MGQKIAAINDDTVFLDLLFELLTEEGYEVHVLKEANSAFERVRELKPDAIILDIRMDHPVSGWQVLELIKLEPALTSVPIVICSADLIALQERATHLQSKGCEILAKPFDLDDLLGVLRRVMPAAD
jgi:DNA-binding response OmpR family regulator